jgi:dihydrofolate reductase
MRKLVIFMMVTLDGYFEGPDHEIDWHNVDAEFNENAVDMLSHAGVLLFGRVTYQLMVNYWPTEMALRDDPIVAERMNSLPKVVFSRTLEKVEWNNTRLVKENAAEEIMKMKETPGKDLVILGSSNLAMTFIEKNLIDEFQIMVNPVVLGSGHPLFNGIVERLKLKLIKTKVFQSGNVMLFYQPDRK